MNTINIFKKWTQSKPYFWLFLMGFCFVFFLVFNFGLDTFKNSRGLASSEDTELAKETSKLVAKNISSVIEGRPMQHSEKPDPQEQFMYGYLQGKYRAVYKHNKFVYIELKKNHQPLEFPKNRKLELMRNVQALFLTPGVTLGNMKTDRQPASLSFSYDMRKQKDLIGQFHMVFTADDELTMISVSGLSH